MKEKIILSLLILISPFWMVGISARITFNSWFIDYEYSKKDFPEDRWGLPDEIRKKLAKIGLKAVLSKEGLEEFKNVKLPDGKKAFREKEIKHMEDVNRFLSIVFPASYVLLFFYLIGVFYLEKYRKKIFLYSGIFTILLIAVIGTISIFFYDKAFAVFHDIFFGKTSWRFKDTDTLLRIYPMKFWFDGTVTVITFSFIISLFLIFFGLKNKN